MAKANDTAPEGGSAMERFHDTDRAFTIRKLSGLTIEYTPGKPTVGILPGGERVLQEDGEDADDFLDRCESRIVTESVFAGGGPTR